MKKKYLNRLLCLFAGITFLITWYFGPLGNLLGKTYKNYYYSKDEQNCLTIIIYSGDGIDFLNSILPNYDPFADCGEGIYIIPGKFRGRLPKDNYVRLSYIGVLDSSPIYYAWRNDSLVLRLVNWGSALTENKLSPAVINDSTFLDCEDVWRYNYLPKKSTIEACDSVKKYFDYVAVGDIRSY